MVANPLWQACVKQLEGELPEQALNTWIRPLHVVEEADTLHLLAPNRFVLNWVRDHYFQRINELIKHHKDGAWRVRLEVGSQGLPVAPVKNRNPVTPLDSVIPDADLNPELTFERFVEGNSNQLARAAALQVASNPGMAYNPFLIYGGVGLGKTHLMHAIGDQIRRQDGKARVLYLRSERFVESMIRALRTNAINELKGFYRSVHTLLIDDIQFLAGKERSQEEFFHTFNTLLERKQQIVLTCDRYPKEVEGLEERLKSRFGWGLTQAIEPPELETRVAILQSKADQMGIELPSEVAFFIAKRIRSNVRELEGALRLVVANAQFTGEPITLELVSEALRDLLALHGKLVDVYNIKRTVAEYFSIRVTDMESQRRTRNVVRPRQLAMALAKELTDRSLPDIGKAFGGRDHTTVLHACRTVEKLRKMDKAFEEDFTNLVRILSS